MQQDVTEHLGVVGSSISRHFQSRSTYQPLSRGPRRSSSETEYLINKREVGDNAADGMISDMPSTSSMVGDVMIVSGGSAVVQKGNRKEYNSNFASKPLAKANRYGATDNLLMPVGEIVLTTDSTSHIHLAGSRITHNTSAKVPSFSTNTATVEPHSNFGINIQKREVHSREYSPQQLYGAPVPGGNSFLQSRNVGAHSSNIPDTDEDFVSLIGSGRWHRYTESSSHSQNYNPSAIESTSVSISASANFSSSLKLSTGESGSCISSDWLSTSHSDENGDNDSDDNDVDDNNLTPIDGDILQMGGFGGHNIDGIANVVYDVGGAQQAYNETATRRSRLRPTNSEHTT